MNKEETKKKKKKRRKKRKGKRSSSRTRWSDSHVLLAVHDEAPHRLAIWVVGSSLTDWMEEGGGSRGRQGGGGGGWSGQLVLLIKAQWPK